MSIFSTLAFITGHPLNRGRKTEAVKRFVQWQIASRLSPGPIVVRFANDSRLVVKPGMKGATGNIYCGLHEFEDMGFLLHLLRPEDLFVDVGANIGSYSILASAAIGARSLSFEPLPGTFRSFRDNIRINGIEGLVEANNLGVGKEKGSLRFTSGLDCVNHVANENEVESGNTVEVPVVPLDSLTSGRHPRLIKIDVEGFETNVISGAFNTLSDPELDAVIMELNGSGERYGYDESEIHAAMLRLGYLTYKYSPFDRSLISLQGQKLSEGNTLYIKNLERVSDRLKSAPPVSVLNHRI